eukprot:5226063-Prymnesium_polylepis.1
MRWDGVGAGIERECDDGASAPSSLITSPWTPPANCCMGCAGGGAKRSAVPPPPPPSVADGAGGAAPSGPLLRSVRWELQGEALVARPRVSLDPRATSGEDDCAGEKEGWQ